jgi:hypothetical protein
MTQADIEERNKLFGELCKRTHFWVELSDRCLDLWNCSPELFEDAIAQHPEFLEHYYRHSIRGLLQPNYNPTFCVIPTEPLTFL